ncbi:MAG: hypothetical protein MZV65_46630 [Chromatiales bacterium]|nr:hypothetical protein [Chromatiales bacterium]
MNTLNVSGSIKAQPNPTVPGTLTLTSGTNTDITDVNLSMTSSAIVQGNLQLLTLLLKT